MSPPTDEFFDARMESTTTEAAPAAAAETGISPTGSSTSPAAAPPGVVTAAVAAPPVASEAPKPAAETPKPTTETPKIAAAAAASTAAIKDAVEKVADKDDRAHWKNRARDMYNRRRNKAPQSSTTPGSAKPWTTSLFDCFSPVHLCAHFYSLSRFQTVADIAQGVLTCCCPCITFGKTHHRVHKGGLEGYSLVNASVSSKTSAYSLQVSDNKAQCFGFFASLFVPCVAALCTYVQRDDVEHKYGLHGTVLDAVFSCCCACCSLVQSAKEVELLEKDEVAPGIQYSSAGEKMEYAPVLAADGPAATTWPSSSLERLLFARLGHATS
jgi:Cys-rich protein (TIGR01571 family)